MVQPRHGTRPAVGAWGAIFACVACAAVLFASPATGRAEGAPATVRVLGHQIRTTHEGIALVRVRCLGPAGARCAGRLRLLAAEARPGLGIARDERLGGALYRLRAGTTAEVPVRLTGAARDVLVRFGRLAVRTDLGAAAGGAAAPTLELVALHSPPVIVDNSRVTVFADGHLRLRVYCDTERALRCRAALTIKDDFERTLAARELRLTGDRHRTVTLRSPQLRRLVARGVEVRAIAATVSTSPAGIETVRHRRLALLPAGDRAGRRGLARRLRPPAASPSAPRTPPR